MNYLRRMFGGGTETPKPDQDADSEPQVKSVEELKVALDSKNRKKGADRLKSGIDGMRPESEDAKEAAQVARLDARAEKVAEFAEQAETVFDGLVSKLDVEILTDHYLFKEDTAAVEQEALATGGFKKDHGSQKGFASTEAINFFAKRDLVDDDVLTIRKLINVEFKSQLLSNFADVKNSNELKTLVERRFMDVVVEALDRFVELVGEQGVIDKSKEAAQKEAVESEETSSEPKVKSLAELQKELDVQSEEKVA